MLGGEVKLYICIFMNPSPQKCFCNRTVKSSSVVMSLAVSAQRHWNYQSFLVETYCSCSGMLVLFSFFLGLCRTSVFYPLLSISRYNYCGQIFLLYDFC